MAVAAGRSPPAVLYSVAVVVVCKVPAGLGSGGSRRRWSDPMAQLQATLAARRARHWQFRQRQNQRHCAKIKMTTDRPCSRKRRPGSKKKKKKKKRQDNLSLVRIAPREPVAGAAAGRRRRETSSHRRNRSRRCLGRFLVADVTVIEGTLRAACRQWSCRYPAFESAQSWGSGLIRRDSRAHDGKCDTARWDAEEDGITSHRARTDAVSPRIKRQKEKKPYEYYLAHPCPRQ